MVIAFTLLSFQWNWAQTAFEIDSLINEISKADSSKELTKLKPAQLIIALGKSALPLLAEIFTDTTLTSVTSVCQHRALTKGEISIIMADRIESMPYYRLTGTQNCLLTFCENSPSLIEYYLNSIADRTEEFQNEYLVWLASDERMEWRPLIYYTSEEERKNEIKVKKKRARNKE